MNLTTFELNNRPALAGEVHLPAVLLLSYTYECIGTSTPNDLKMEYTLILPNPPQHIKFDNNGSKVTHIENLTAYFGNVDDNLKISSTAPYTAPYQITIKITPRIDNHQPISPEFLVLTIIGNTVPPVLPPES